MHMNGLKLKRNDPLKI